MEIGQDDGIVLVYKSNKPVSLISDLHRENLLVYWLKGASLFVLSSFLSEEFKY